MTTLTPPPSVLEQTAQYLCSQADPAASDFSIQLTSCIMESAHCNDLAALRVLRDHAFPVGKGLAESLRQGHVGLLDMLAAEDPSVFLFLLNSGSLSLELWLAAASSNENASSPHVLLLLERMKELAGGQVRSDVLFRSTLFGAAPLEMLKWFLAQWRSQGGVGTDSVLFPIEKTLHLAMRKPEQTAVIQFLVGETLLSASSMLLTTTTTTTTPADVRAELFALAMATMPHSLELAVLLHRGEFLPGMAPTTAEDHRSAMEDAAGRPAALAFLLRIGTPWPTMHLPACAAAAHDDCLELLLSPHCGRCADDAATDDTDDHRDLLLLQHVADPENLRSALLSALGHARYRAASSSSSSSSIVTTANTIIMKRRHGESEASTSIRHEWVSGAARSVLLLESVSSRLMMMMMMKKRKRGSEE